MDTEHSDRGTGPVAGRRPAVTAVLLVGEHRMFCDLLAVALGHAPGFEVVGVVAEPADAGRLSLRCRPAVVVVDLAPEGAHDDGLDVPCGASGASSPAPRSWRCRPAAATRRAPAPRLAGASACVPKSAALGVLVGALREAVAGSGVPTPPPPLPPLPTRRRSTGPSLTSREREVLTLMGTGAAPAAIAAALNITLETCRGYVKSIHVKLDARSQLESVVKAQRLGLIDIGA